MCHDMFQSLMLNAANLKPARAYFIAPDFDLKSIGVNFTAVTPEGIEAAYKHGYTKGEVLAEKLAAIYFS